MKQIIILTTLFLFTGNFSNAQCDFPRNNGTVQYQNAIIYGGKIKRTVLPDERTVFSISPSQLGFKKHDLTGDTITVSNEGVWYYRWNYAASPNRWQPLPFDCDATSCSLKNIFGGAVRTGWIECDFFYLDSKAGVSATFQGSVVYDIARGIAYNTSGQKSTGDKID